MPLRTLALLTALAQPTDVLEERVLLDAPPLREAVTLRLRYARAQGPLAALPVPPGVEPTVTSPGTATQLHPTRTPSGWQLRLPEGSSETARVVLHFERPLASARAFQLRWPEANTLTPRARRLLRAPEPWIREVRPPWRCTNDERWLLCLADTEAPPLALQLPPLRPPRAAALTLALALALLAWRLRSPEERVERVAGSLGGALLGASLAWAWAGQGSPYATAASLAAPFASLVGAALGPSTRARPLLGLLLLAVPCGAILGVSASLLSGGALLVTCASGLLAWREASSLAPSPTPAADPA